MSVCDRAHNNKNCIFPDNSTGVVLIYNSTCTICCEEGYGFPMEFQLQPYCYEWTNQAIAVKVFVFVVLYIVALVCTVCLMVIHGTVQGDESNRSPAIPIIYLMNVLVIVIALCDNIVVFSHGRYDPDSANLLWLLVFLATCLSFFVHEKTIYKEIRSKYIALPDNEHRKFGLSKQRLSWIKPRGSCSISSFLACLILFSGAQAILGFIIYSHASSIRSADIFGFIFGFVIVNQLLTLCEGGRRWIFILCEVILSIVFMTVILVTRDSMVAEVFYSFHLLWIVAIVVPCTVLRGPK